MGTFLQGKYFTSCETIEEVMDIYVDMYVDMLSSAIKSLNELIDSSCLRDDNSQKSR